MSIIFYFKKVLYSFWSSNQLFVWHATVLKEEIKLELD